MAREEKGMLYLVATPIGNLQDITLRALTILREVDYVASEDTRKTGLLLKHFEISKPQIAFHEHNEEQAGQRIEELLKQGRSIALVTDAGTPGIADPGFTLVRPARAQLHLSRLPAPQARRTPPLPGNRPALPPHPHLLRKPLPPRSLPTR